MLNRLENKFPQVEGGLMRQIIDSDAEIVTQYLPYHLPCVPLQSQPPPTSLLSSSQVIYGKHQKGQSMSYRQSRQAHDDLRCTKTHRQPILSHGPEPDKP